MKQEIIFQLTRLCDYYQYPTSKKNFKIARKFYVYADKDEKKLFTYTFNGYPVNKYMYNYLYMLQIGRENNLDNHEKRDIQSFFQKKWISILNDDLAIDLPSHEKEIQEIKKRSAEKYKLNTEKFKSIIKGISEKTLIPEENLTFPGVYGKIFYADKSILKILNNVVKNYTLVKIENFDMVCSFIKDNTVLDNALSLRNYFIEQNKLIELPKKFISPENHNSLNTFDNSSNSLLMLCAVSELFQPISVSDENDIKRFKK